MDVTMGDVLKQARERAQGYRDERANHEPWELALIFDDLADEIERLSIDKAMSTDIKAALKVIEVLQSEVSDPALADRLMAEGESALADLEMFKRELGI